MSCGGVLDVHLGKAGVGQLFVWDGIWSWGVVPVVGRGNWPFVRGGTNGYPRACQRELGAVVWLCWWV